MKKINGYKPETIKKYIALCNYWVAYFLSLLASGVQLLVTFSDGNSKIGKVLNVSILPIKSCGSSCKCGCHRFCYDIKACLRFVANCLATRAKNYVLAMYARDEYFRQIDEKMSRRRCNLYMRWHVGGELPDIDYFSRIVDNAKNHAEYESIWTYTKRYEIVNEYIANHGGSMEAAFPGNFHPMFSQWRGVPIDNPYGLPVFYTIDTTEGDEVPQNMWCCPGNCDVCKHCKRGCVVGENTYAHMH